MSKSKNDALRVDFDRPIREPRNPGTWSLLAGMLGLAVLLAAKGPAQDEQPPPDPAPQDGVSVLTRGPVHEAYAEPSETQPQASPLVTKQPPDPVEEVPPDQKPEGDNLQWIPGYWQFDGDTQDFLWVSGFWRDVPPGRRWVPGFWQPVEGGWRWVAGFWAADGQEEVEYLPPPPPTLDKGPSTPAPDEDSTYVPGCWVYRETRFFWRPGYWVAVKPDWCWIPDRYVWTPSGCLFVNGYWDHPLHERGLLFAPVRFDRDRLRERFTYVPQYVVQPDFLMSALFVRQANCHYYFGDYFEQNYERRGYTPWVDYRVARGVYDPNFAWYHNRYAGDKKWESNLRKLYAGRRSGDVPRPPRTLVQQRKMIKDITVNKTANVNVIKTINVTNIQNVTALAPLRQARTCASRPWLRSRVQGARDEAGGEDASDQAGGGHQGAASAAPEGGPTIAPVSRAASGAGSQGDPGGEGPGQADRPAAAGEVGSAQARGRAAPEEETGGTTRAARKAPPPKPPTPPKHEDRPIPPHEPPQPIRPPTAHPAPRRRRRLPTQRLLHTRLPRPPPAPHPAAPPAPGSGARRRRLRTQQPRHTRLPHRRRRPPIRRFLHTRRLRRRRRLPTRSAPPHPAPPPPAPAPHPAAPPHPAPAPAPTPTRRLRPTPLLHRPAPAPHPAPLHTRHLRTPASAPHPAAPPHPAPPPPAPAPHPAAPAAAPGTAAAQADDG